MAITGTSGLLAWDGPGIDHAPSVLVGARQVMTNGKAVALGPRDLRCADGVDCPLRSGVVVPLTSGGVVVGTLVALAPSTRAGLLRAAGEVARFASTQLELAELDSARARAAEAELRFLRAQISPHFVYNALTAIASFMRSDPGPGTRPAARLRRLHPVQLPQSWSVRDDRRRVASGRHLSRTRARPVRRPPSGRAPDCP